jgi:hypothetical protein
MNPAMRRAVRAGKRRKEVIEGAILLDQYQDVLDFPIRLCRSGGAFDGKGRCGYGCRRTPGNRNRERRQQTRTKA